MWAPVQAALSDVPHNAPCDQMAIACVMSNLSSLQWCMRCGCKLSVHPHFRCVMSVLLCTLLCYAHDAAMVSHQTVQKA